MKTLSLGYSPCPNDTFIFYALVHGKIETGDLRFKEILLDVEALNQKALKGELDITKVSYNAFGNLKDDYCLLRSGGALGRGCGPLVVARQNYSMKDLKGKRIAIPGRLTTAYLLLQLYDPSFKETFILNSNTKDNENVIPRPPITTFEGMLNRGIQEDIDSRLRTAGMTEKKVFSEQNVRSMPFNKIMDAVKNGEVDAGLIIHESRFTYPSYGLKQVIDLGEWWEKETGLPIPLGCIISKRSLGKELIQKVDRLIKDSVLYAMNNRNEPKKYIKEHSQELEDSVIESHINLYVNEYSIDIGDDGIRAVKRLFEMAEEKGIIKKSAMPMFV